MPLYAPYVSLALFFTIYSCDETSTIVRDEISSVFPGLKLNYLWFDRFFPWYDNVMHVKGSCILFTMYHFNISIRVYNHGPVRIHYTWNTIHKVWYKNPKIYNASLNVFISFSFVDIFHPNFFFFPNSIFLCFSSTLFMYHLHTWRIVNKKRRKYRTI